MVLVLKVVQKCGESIERPVRFRNFLETWDILKENIVRSENADEAFEFVQKYGPFPSLSLFFLFVFCFENG